MSGIWVAGEALIDLVPDVNGNVKAIVGGGPANTARAVARLGLESFFIGGISSDSYGKMIEDLLQQSGVLLDLVKFSNLPTATAAVTLDSSGSAKYEFSLDNTATFEFASDWLPGGEPTVLHCGTLGALIEPGATELFEWAKQRRSTIVFDPNVRPSVLSDSLKYRRLMERWFQVSDVIKLSEDDFHWLYGDKEPYYLLDFGPKLIVLTHGAKGISAFMSGCEVSAPGYEVEVIDTVGAGDTVGAILLESISKSGVNGLMEDLPQVLNRATKAAAITCSRAGAQPPTIAELANF